jgi:hypothetical protein
MGRSPCCDKLGIKKGPWTPEEDQQLVAHIQRHGHGSWRALPTLAGMHHADTNLITIFLLLFSISGQIVVIYAADQAMPM